MQGTKRLLRLTGTICPDSDCTRLISTACVFVRTQCVDRVFEAVSARQTGLSYVQRLLLKRADTARITYFECRRIYNCAALRASLTSNVVLTEYVTTQFFG